MLKTPVLVRSPKLSNIGRDDQISFLLPTRSPLYVGQLTQHVTNASTPPAAPRRVAGSHRPRRLQQLHQIPGVERLGSARRCARPLAQGPFLLPITRAHQNPPLQRSDDGSHRRVSTIRDCRIPTFDVLSSNRIQTLRVFRCPTSRRRYVAPRRRPLLLPTSHLVTYGRRRRLGCTDRPVREKLHKYEARRDLTPHVHIPDDEGNTVDCSRISGTPLDCVVPSQSVVNRSEVQRVTPVPGFMPREHPVAFSAQSVTENDNQLLDFEITLVPIMADTVAANAPATAPAQASPKKTKSSSSKKPRAKPAHPRTSEMVISAIKSLKERGGSSLQAIKKYIAANYKVDPEKFAPFIKKYLKAAVASGELVQTKGKGASGSFKLASAAKPEKAAASSAPSRSKASGPKEKKQTPSKAKRSTPKSPKKAAAKRGSDKKKETFAAKAKKSPSKIKKASKVPTKKPKAPKPKKVAKAKAPKKASPKKK